MKKSIALATAAALCFAALPLCACNKGEGKKISKYTIEASYDEESATLTGTCGCDFYNSTDNEICDLKFNIWGNAYREGAKYKPVSDAFAAKAYYDGVSYGGMSVEKVEGCASWEVGGEDETVLSVSLNEPIYPDERVEVCISYSLKLAKVNHRTGVTQSGVNLGNFYPVLCAYTTEGFMEAPYYSYGDPFVSECADYEVKLTFPEGYMAATSGKAQSHSAADGLVTESFSLPCARDFAAVLSTDFKTTKATLKGCEVVGYYTGEECPERAFNAACEAVEYFSEAFGAYPYPTLSVVFTPLSMSGMEYPALTMISDGLEESDAVYTAVHETAHQWWYALVGSDQVNCAFMDEGLAEYSTLCFFETHPDYGFTRTGIIGGAIKAYRAYYSVYNQIFGKADTSMRRSLSQFASDYEYINVAYNKSILMFDSVRCAMGDKKFFEALKNYFDANVYKLACCEELIARFAELHDVEGLLAGYIDGKVVI